ncbi:MAG: hypothetical protein M1819_005819 [Sarea resinae]|nr:MAG: hypothetical protein M1819_005819 [Sarea resinae]
MTVLPEIRQPEPIAIVGVGCRFPGDINSPSKLWDAISERRDLMMKIPKTRFDTRGFYHPDGERHGCTNVDKAYLLGDDDEHRRFDSEFFKINPREAEAIDPQQRILLEIVYEAMEAGGFTIDEMQGSNTSVYVGLMNGDYYELQARDPETMPKYTATGTARSIISNRVSYFFDWKGPSMTIDTACSSSLVALHHAVGSLRAGESNVAVAAGANLILGPEMMISESKLHMLSPTGRSRMWDASADGYARGEGFAAVILKTLSQALADGDHIECIIRETGVNQDGHTQGITMPSASSQTALIRQTYAKAGLDVRTDRCQYFEAHGTGTPAGDPIEARAIRDAFFPEGTESADRVSSRESSPLFVGSVKTTIGHLEGCAGLAGIIKASEALRRGTIPLNMLFERLNPQITPLYHHLQLPTENQPWPELAPGQVRRASVNSFGFGGTNAHVILESFEDPDSLRLKPASASRLFPIPLAFSASSQTSLASSVSAYISFLRSDDSVKLEDIAWALTQRRTQHSFRTIFSGLNREKILSKMEAAVEKTRGSPPAWFGHRSPITPSDEGPRLLWVFTGQGAQWPGMARDLIVASHKARESLARLDEALAELPDGPSWSIIQILMDESSNLSEAAYSQPICTAVQLMLVDLLVLAGVEFHAVVGHSSGEIGAAYAAGIITAPEAIKIAYYRGFHAKLARNASGGIGAMMAVGIPYDEGRKFCARPEFAGRIDVAASNAPKTVTLSGDEDAIQEAKQVFDEEKTFARLLKVDTAYHSHHMQACAAPYLQSLKACNIAPKKPTCLWISSVHGRQIGSEDTLAMLSHEYWNDNMVNPVLFSQAIEKTIELSQGQLDLALEIGPHPALKGPTTQTFKAITGKDLPYNGTLSRGDNDVESLSNALGYLWIIAGSEAVDFGQYQLAFGIASKPSTQLLSSLPRYSWDHERTFWKESRASKNYRLRDRPRHDLLGSRCPDDLDQDMRWRNVIRLEEVPWLVGHQVQSQVIFPAAGYLVMAMESSKELARDRPIQLVELQDVEILRAIALDEDSGAEVTFNLKMVEQTESTITADFSCFSSGANNSDSWTKNVSGRLQVFLGDPDPDTLPPPKVTAQNLTSIDIDRFYSSLSDIGLSYSGLFQGLGSVDRKMFQSHGLARDISEENDKYMIHPALLDCSFQTIFAAFCWPGDGTLRSPYVPTNIRRIRVAGSDLRDAAEQNIGIDCCVTGSTSDTVVADVEISNTGTGRLRVQVEELKCTLLDRPGPANDRQLYAETVWNTDIASGIDVPSEQEDSPVHLELVELCERLAYYYLRNLDKQIPREDVPSFVWNHQRIFEFIDYLFPLIESGRHPTILKEWSHDSEAYLFSQAAKYSEQIDVQLISAVGRNLPAVVRGETSMLEHMIENDMLNRVYKYGLGFERANAILSAITKQVAHRYPDMDILEIGAGTGGATKGILESLGQTFGSYAYTDISTGFFEKAQEAFHNWTSKLKFKALNIEEDVIAQGYEEKSYDFIVASNVLHATKSLKVTMQNVRKLLKPGGYLVLLEITSDILRVKLMMSGLPGWWLGGDDGRRYAPTITQAQWDSVLRETGFSGVDHIAHDMVDSSKHMTSVILSQAVDDDIYCLRDPLSFASPLLPLDTIAVIGGKSRDVSKTLGDITDLLRAKGNAQIRHFEDFESLSAVEWDAKREPLTAVVCLVDLDEPVFRSFSSSKLQGMQRMFNEARQVLWITSGCRNSDPYANMSIGVGRSLIYEYSHIRLQYLDLDAKAKDRAAHVVSAILRLIAADKLELSSKKLLWTNEPELVIEDDRTLVPRIVPNQILNNRLNSADRAITQQLDTSKTAIHIDQTDNIISLRQVQPSIKEVVAHQTISIRVTHSLLSSIRLSEGLSLFVCLGLVIGSSNTGELPAGAQVLALSETNGTIIQVPSSRVAYASIAPETEEAIVLNVAMNLLTSEILADVPSGRSILLVEPDDILGSLVTQRAPEMGISTQAISSNSSAHKDVHFIHPRTLKREIRALISPDTLEVLDFSGATGQNVLNLEGCLPAECTVKHIRTLFDKGAKISSALETLSLRDKLSQAHLISETAFLRRQKCTASKITLQELAADLSPKPYHYVVDFTKAGNVPTIVKPIISSELFRNDRTYFLSGCTGGLGKSLTRYMLRNGARYLVLTSRNASTVDSIWLEELREMGGIIKVYGLDVSDRTALIRVCDEISRTLPPVAGVANAAMVLSDKLFGDLSIQDFLQVLKPKVDGTKNLHECLPKKDLDFFILFSSLASVVGNRGQSNYGAANLFMTSFAAWRRQNGLPASVLDIGMVLGVGYVSQTGVYESTLRKYNYMPISESLFHGMFANAILAGRPDSGQQPEVITGLHRIMKTEDDGDKAFWHENPRFSHYVFHEESVGQNLSSTALVSLKQQLKDAQTLEETIQYIEDAFVGKLERILQVPAANIERAQPLLNLGVDSLMAVEIRSWFLKETDVDVSVLKILGGASVTELCREAAARRTKQEALAAEVANAPKAEITTDKPSAVPEISVEEADQSENDNRDTPPSELDSSVMSHTGSLFDDNNSERGSISTRSGDYSTPNLKELPTNGQARLVELDSLLSTKSYQHVERMSFAQERLWFLRVYLEDPTAYNVTMAYQIDGPLRVDAFEAAFKAVINRHQLLRSSFFLDSKTSLAMQGVRSSSPFTLEKKHLRSEHGHEVMAKFHEVRRHIHDLEHGDTMIATLFTQSSEKHTLILGFHHIAFDGFSAQIFVKDLARAYSGQHLENLSHPYTEFATKQRAWLVEDASMASDLSYWKSQYPDLPPTLPLFDFCQVKSRKPLTSYNMRAARTIIEPKFVSSLRAISRAQGVTLFHAHLAILQILLFKFLNLEDVSIGIIDANRTDSDFLDTVGFFVNLLPLRFRLQAGDSYQDIVRAARVQALSALDHSRLPFDVLLDELMVPRSTTHSPLFQVTMNYRVATFQKAAIGDTTATLIHSEDAQNPYDLAFDVEELANGSTSLSLKSQAYLYTDEDLSLLLKTYVHLLGSVTQADGQTLPIERLSYFDQSDIQKALQLGKGDELDVNKYITIPDIVDIVELDAAGDIAVKDESGHSLTFSQLIRRIHIIASALLKANVKPTEFVAVHCEPTINSVCYLLAIQRIGAIYVPLDLQNPTERLQLIVEDCQPAAIICHQATEESTRRLNISKSRILNFGDFNEQEFPHSPVVNMAVATSPACAIYTSGSTGTPKGIVLTHINLINQIQGVKKRYGIGKEVIMQQSSLGFDVSLDQMLQAVTSGGTLVVASRQTRGDPIELAKLMLSEKVTYTYATPSEYVALLRYGSDILRHYTAWRFAFVGGEALPSHLIHEFHLLGMPDLHLLNRYGPTEISVSSSISNINTSDPACMIIQNPTIGSTLPNYRTYIVDKDLAPLPIGFPGEIVIAGAGVALGYLNNPELTQLKFLSDPFVTPDNIASARGWNRMYRTGDKGRLLTTGDFAYLGRMDGDSQIKLRGFRIELDDIANNILLASERKLADAAISLRGQLDDEGDRRFLVAFVVPAAGQSVEDIRPYLKDLQCNLPLPLYMIPAMMIPVKHLPRNSNGKMDRRALNAIPLPKVEDGHSITGGSELEHKLAKIWKDCLPEAATSSLGLDSNTDFFEVGGNSLLLVKLQALVRRDLGAKIPLLELFQTSTLGSMASRIALRSGGTQEIKEIDWTDETAIGREERLLAARGSTEKPVSNENIEVLLTGATGFVGSALLQSLVADPNISRVHCVAIRPDKSSNLSDRLKVKSDKIVPYAGDLSAPLLGLSPADFQALSGRVDRIVHNGADVSFLKSYGSLRKANFESTKTLVHLALPRRIPFHFISTGGVARLVGSADSLAEVSVMDHPPPRDGSDGYVAAKWASERFLQRCAEDRQLRLPCTIHRPSSVVAASGSADAAVPETDLMANIIALSLEMGAVPDTRHWKGKFDFVRVSDVARRVRDQLLLSATSSSSHNTSDSTTTTPAEHPPRLRFLHHCAAASAKIPAEQLKAYLESRHQQQQDGRRRSSLQTLAVDDWMARARECGLAGALEAVVRETLEAQGPAAVLPSLLSDVE